MDTFLGVLFLIICLLLIIVVLLQKGRGGGLGAAFGGAGSSAFGTRTGDVFTWVTVVLTAMFLLLAIGTTLYFRPKAGEVRAPVFAPPGGTPVANQMEVTIRCSTEGALIFYTTDGSDPTEKSQPLDKPFITVRGGMTLKARAFRHPGTPSPITTAYYPLPSATRPAAAPPASAPALPVIPPAPRPAPAPTATAPVR